MTLHTLENITTPPGALRQAGWVVTLPSIPDNGFEILDQSLEISGTSPRLLPIGEEERNFRDTVKDRRCYDIEFDGRHFVDTLAQGRNPAKDDKPLLVQIDSSDNKALDALDRVLGVTKGSVLRSGRLHAIFSAARNVGASFVSIPFAQIEVRDGFVTLSKKNIQWVLLPSRRTAVAILHNVDPFGDRIENKHEQFHGDKEDPLAFHVYESLLRMQASTSKSLDRIESCLDDAIRSVEKADEEVIKNASSPHLLARSNRELARLTNRLQRTYDTLLKMKEIIRQQMVLTDRLTAETDAQHIARFFDMSTRRDARGRLAEASRNGHGEKVRNLLEIAAHIIERTNGIRESIENFTQQNQARLQEVKTRYDTGTGIVIGISGLCAAGLQCISQVEAWRAEWMIPGVLLSTVLGGGTFARVFFQRRAALKRLMNGGNGSEE